MSGDEFPVYRSDDFPHGLRCAECGETFVDSQPISERLDGFQDDTALVTVVCAPCALSGAA